MKHIKIFFLCILFTIVIYTVNAATDCTSLNDALAYYSFDADCQTDDSGNGNTGTNNGASNVPGRLNNGCDFEDGESDYITINSLIENFNQNFSVVAWYKKESNDGTEIIFSSQNTPVTIYHLLYQDVNWFYSTSKNVNTNYFRTGDANLRDTNYHFVVNVLDNNADNIFFYVDNQDESDVESDTGNFNLVTLSKVTIGAYYSGSYTGFFDGILDEIGVWNRTLTINEMTNLWNDGAGCNPFDAPAINASLTLNNINLSTGNYTEDFWFSFNGTTENTDHDNFNCTMEFNNTLNNSFTLEDIHLEQSFLLSYCGEQIGYDINISCMNNNATDNFLIQDVFLDCIILPYTTDFINESIYTDEETIEFHFNLSDPNLYAYNFSIMNSGSVLINSIFEENLGVSFYQLNITNSSLTIDSYEMNLTYWDSHTGENLKYKPEVIDNKFYYNNIEFTCADIKKIEYKEYKDKIKLNIKFNNFQNLHTCWYKGSFKSVLNSNYQNHYLDLSKGIWIDDLLSTQSYIQGNIVYLEYYNEIPFNEIKTDSIGDLNVYSQLYSFSVIDAPDLSLEQQQNQSDLLYQILLEDIEQTEGINMIAWVFLLILDVSAVLTGFYLHTKDFAEILVKLIFLTGFALSLVGWLNTIDLFFRYGFVFIFLLSVIGLFFSSAGSEYTTE